MKKDLNCKKMDSNVRFHADPSGTLTQYDAKAIGSGSEGAQTELQEQYHKVFSNLQVSYFA
jgi:20S proteasome alpha/beta subunit